MQHDETKNWTHEIRFVDDVWVQEAIKWRNEHPVPQRREDIPRSNKNESLEALYWRLNKGSDTVVEGTEELAVFTPSEWDSGYDFTEQCFNAACSQAYDIMEQYIIRLMSTNDPDERQEIMRSGMRETVKQRY